jgi:chloramphenicol-sensitive protein RarD
MPDPNQANANRGYVAAASGFAIWGIFPLYFHALGPIPALQVISHRVVWSCVFVLALMAIRGELGLVRAALTNRGVVLRLAASATLICVNWVVYVFGVTHDRVVEASLGYFIGPLVNVLLGVILLSERLTPAQWASVALASLGVGYLTVMAGGLPLIALTLAVSFAGYGLIRKVVNVESLPGLASETLLLVPFALADLTWSESTGSGAFGHSGTVIDAMLIFSGPLTAISLFLFAYGTRRLPYSTVGALQYITPSLQFACGVFVLHEPFDHARAIGFAVIWSALIIYAGEGMRLSRKQQAQTATA